MAFNLKAAADFWVRVFGDTVAPGDGSTASLPTRLDQYNSDMGRSLTIIADDGDLQTIDTAAEAIALDSTANSVGAASAKYSLLFLFRWLIKLVQSFDRGAGTASANTIRAVLSNDPTAATGTISAADVGSVTTVTAAGQSLITGTPTASSFVSTAVSARSSCTIQITGTFVGTIAVERSMDGGVTWVGARMIPDGGESAFQSTTTPSVSSINVAGRTTVRVRAIAWTSGSAAIVLLPSAGVSLIRSDQVTTASLLFRTQALTSTSQQVKNASGRIVGWNIYNPNTVPSFLKLYDSASPTVGTTTPLDTIAIPAFSSFLIKEPTSLYSFTTALSVAVTSGDADNTNVTPTLPLRVSIYYV